MLFAIKNHAAGSLAVLAVFVLAAWPLHTLLGLDWHFGLDSSEAVRLGLAMVAMAASDGGLHGLFLMTIGNAYLSRYRLLVDYFAAQGWPARIAGSLLAGGEELVFRGLVLEGLRAPLGWAGALGVSSLLFGLCHLIPRPGLWIFAAWAIWEGALLGGVYLWTGSLAVVLCLHAAHDLAGFSLFAWQRRTGWLLG